MFEDLVKRAGIKPKREIILAALDYFPITVNAAEMRDDAEVAKMLYFKTLNLPQDSTKARIASKGTQVACQMLLILSRLHV